MKLYIVYGGDVIISGGLGRLVDSGDGGEVQLLGGAGGDDGGHIRLIGRHRTMRGRCGCRHNPRRQ